MSQDLTKSFNIAYALKRHLDYLMANQIDHNVMGDALKRKPFGYSKDVQDWVLMYKKREYPTEPRHFALIRDYKALVNKVIQSILGTWITHGMIARKFVPVDVWATMSCHDPVDERNLEHTLIVAERTSTIKTEELPTELYIVSDFSVAIGVRKYSGQAYVAFRLEDWRETGWNPDRDLNARNTIVMLSMFGHEIAKKAYDLLNIAVEMFTYNYKYMDTIDSIKWLADIVPIKVDRKAMAGCVPKELAKMLGL